MCVIIKVCDSPAENNHHSLKESDFIYQRGNVSHMIPHPQVETCLIKTRAFAVDIISPLDRTHALRGIMTK